DPPHGAHLLPMDPRQREPDHCRAVPHGAAPMIHANVQAERGQALPLLALFVLVLIGFAALAIDVSGALSARRFYRRVADGAALAGAQDLQQTGSRAVSATERIQARTDA